MSEQLIQLLKAAGLAARPSYRPGEVQKILGISSRTFCTMVMAHEKDAYGNPLNPATLDSYMLFRERRVTHQELEAFLKRNETYERVNAIPINQIKLPFE